MQLKKNLLTATLLAIGSLTAVSTTMAASPATGSFKVLLTVQSNCKVTAGVGTQDINFGTVDADTVAKTAIAATPIAVACSKGTPFKVGLSPTGTSTNGTGTLKSTTSDEIAYALYSDTAATTVWGNNTAASGGNTVGGIGQGLGATTFKYTATAKVTTTDVTPGAYSDTVNVTVTY